MTDRKPIITGNWKMNTTPSEGRDLALEIAKGSSDFPGVEVIVCPPFIGLANVSKTLEGTAVRVGAQNASAEPSGAFTGEVSLPMLDELVTHVILGHSERRALFCETDEDVAQKAIAASEAGISPIVCVGESLDVRQGRRAVEFVRSQLRASLAGFAGWDALVLAYEPVWAIGTGHAASPQQAQEIIGEMRKELAVLAGAEAASEVRILYGGSVKAGNVGPFVDRPDIDGALVGGASLDSIEFCRIIEVTAGLYTP